MQALLSIGVPSNNKLLANLFWIFDVNGDEMVDSKEFGYVSSILRGYSLADKIRSKLVNLSSFCKTCGY